MISLKKMSILFTILFAASGLSLAQDKIYFATETKDGKVTEITADKIKFKNASNPGPVYTVSRKKVLLLFSSQGKFIANTSISDPAADQEITRNFLSDGAIGSDYLITRDKQVLPVVIKEEKLASIVYQTEGAVSKKEIRQSDLAIVIRENGQHTIYGEVADVANILAEVQNKYYAALSAPGKSSMPEVAVKSEPVEKASNTSAGSVTPVADKETKPVAGVAKSEPTSVSTTSSVKSANMPDLEVSFEEYEKKALHKTQDLNTYLKILCDKSTGYEEANKAIDQAVDLFISEEAVVEVSNKGRKETVRYKIREYLKRMKLIKYSKVEIEWTNMQYVGKLRKGPDGNYYGIISFQQVFRGYLDNKLVYSDITKKNSEIVLKSYNRNAEGRTTTNWEVLLSDIGVVVTKG